MLPWLLNTMAGVLRGTGNMKLPSLLILNSAVLADRARRHAWASGSDRLPQLGMRGVAAGALIAYSMNICVMGWYLFSGRARVVPKLRGLAHPMGDVLRHPEGRRHRLLLAAAIGADDLDLHPHAGQVRHRDPRRLRHRRAARISADLDRVLVRHRLGADDRHGDRRRRHRARAAHRLDRRRECLRRRRCAGLPRRVVPRSLGQHLHGQRDGARDQPPISVDGGAVLRFHRARLDDVLLVARCGQGDRSGAGADGAAGLHRDLRLVVVDPRCDRAELFLARREFDGRARPAVMFQRGADALGPRSSKPAVRPVLSVAD